MDITVRKYCAGCYTVTDGVNEVEVTKENFGHGTEWVARAVGINYVYSDPVPTKRQATSCAISILKMWTTLKKV